MSQNLTTIFGWEYALWSEPFDEPDKKWFIKESRRWPALLQVLSDARLSTEA